MVRMYGIRKKAEACEGWWQLILNGRGFSLIPQPKTKIRIKNFLHLHILAIASHFPTTMNTQSSLAFPAWDPAMSNPVSHRIG